MGAVRLELQLSSHTEWIKIFDPRDWTVFVATPTAIEQSEPVRIDLNVDGWLVTLRGAVVGHRDEPAGVVVALSGSERDKINYLNGFVRGGLLNLREKRRLPIRLAVTYGAIEGPAKTFTKDINEEGVFLFTDKPLPETSQVHMLVTLPGRADPLSLIGKVSHTILDDDHEPPGMGIVFDLDDAARDRLAAIIVDLERQLAAGQLPTGSLE
ncbi:MAG TPA: PilZ domain-containing protein [Kofleriaceae bacterium]|nr:PilZ domain-containing protein [Kofleriaceae bacterium]